MERGAREREEEREQVREEENGRKEKREWGAAGGKSPAKPY